MAQIIADVQGKELKYEMVFHSTDLRYALSGEKMKEMGWVPKDIRGRIRDMDK